MTDRLGKQLGNYRLTQLLGQGGFAEVYLGEHPLLGTKVAIKVLHAQVTQEDVAQFQQEARRLASLRHPHIPHSAVWKTLFCYSVFTIYTCFIRLLQSLSGKFLWLFCYMCRTPLVQRRVLRILKGLLRI